MGLAKRRDESTAAELIAALRRLHLTSADLRSLVELTREFVGEDLERRVTQAKASRDGRGLPEAVLRGDLVKGDCQCTAALRWTANE